MKLAYISAVVVVVVLVLFVSDAYWTGRLLAQNAPKLKADVALVIRDLQLQRSENQTKMLVMQQQYQQATESVKELDSKLAEKLKTALKDSDLDPEKFTVDPQTLAVTPKPVSGVKP